jgi:hypothetical protein
MALIAKFPKFLEGNNCATNGIDIKIPKIPLKFY